MGEPNTIDYSDPTGGQQDQDTHVNVDIPGAGVIGLPKTLGDSMHPIAQAIHEHYISPAGMANKELEKQGLSVGPLKSGVKLPDVSEADTQITSALNKLPVMTSDERSAAEAAWKKEHPDVTLKNGMTIPSIEPKPALGEPGDIPKQIAEVGKELGEGDYGGAAGTVGTQLAIGALMHKAGLPTEKRIAVEVPGVDGHILVPAENANAISQIIHEMMGPETPEKQGLPRINPASEPATKLQVKEGLTPEGANFSNEEIARQARGEKYYTVSKGGNITAQMSQPDAASDLKGGAVVKVLPDGTYDVQRGDSSIAEKYKDRVLEANKPPTKEFTPEQKAQTTKDNDYIAQAKTELGEDASVSDVLKRAQELKVTDAANTKLSVKDEVTDQWDKIINSTEPDTTTHLQNAYPNGEVKQIDENNWHVKTAAGHDISVIKTPSVSTEGSGITLKNNQYAAGSWQEVKNGGVMHLAKLEGGQDTVHHEAFHSAWDLALDDADRKAITNRYGSEEAAAEAYGKWNPQAEPHTMFEKIQNYFRRMYNSVVSPDKNLFADVRSGKVWEEASERRVSNDSSINFSITTKPKWEASFSKLAPALGGLDEAQIAKAKSAVNEVSSVMESMKDLLPPEDKGLKGEAAKPIKKNQDYLRTVDMNTICPRTNRFQSTIDGIQKKLGRMLAGDERLEVAKNMQQQGHTSPCAYCYVEQGRNRMVNRVKRLASEAGVPERALFDDKFKQQLIVDNPNMSKAIEGVQTEAKKPMMVNIEKPYKPYTNQILKWDQPLVDEINGRAGLRFFSSTDFQPEHMLDLMQVVSDAGARGLKAHGYTKEPDFVRTFGNTGIKINMSIHAHGGVDGAPILESPESMPWKDAQQLRKQYPNAGTMLMVTNDAQLDYALKQDWVDMAIPFHGDRPAMYKTGPERWTDYSGEQHETDIKTGKTAPRIDQVDHHNDVDTYLKLVQERGALPRFARFIYDNNDLVIKQEKNGVSSVTLKPGVTEPRIIEANKAGYMKLIRDIARTDSPHEVVQPNFDTKQAVKVLKQWEKGGGTHKEAIPEVVKDMSKQLVQIAPAK